jgi:hypothetical protein
MMGLWKMEAYPPEAAHRAAHRAAPVTVNDGAAQGNLQDRPQGPTHP